MDRKNYIWLLLLITGLLVYGWLDPEKFPFPKCPFLSLTGWECPGCGSQRAMHQFVHGHWVEAFKLNFLFIPALMYVMIGITARQFFPTGWLKIRSVGYSRNAAILILVIIIGYWIFRNIM